MIRILHFNTHYFIVGKGCLTSLYIEEEAGTGFTDRLTASSKIIVMPPRSIPVLVDIAAMMTQIAFWMAP